jgi:hypothetical protein
MNQTEKKLVLTALKHGRSGTRLIHLAYPHIEDCTSSFDTVIAIIRSDRDETQLLAETLAKFYGPEFGRNDYSEDEFADNLVRDGHDSIEKFIRGPLAKAAYKILMEEKRNTHEPDTIAVHIGQVF